MNNLYNATNIAVKILNWYDQYKRDLPWRDSQDPYHIWLSEIMLQQTKVESVIPYYTRWLEKYPRLIDVSNAKEGDLLKLWEGLGYYNRCRNFKKSADIVRNVYNGKIPSNYDDLIKLPGVGQYTASAILSIAYEKSFPALDGNITRVMARVLKMKKLSLYNKQIISRRVQQWMECGSPGKINQALMDIGNQICKPNQAHCYKCPIENFCGAVQTISPESYPTPKHKSPIPKYDVVTGLIWKKGQFLILCREDKNHLGGLWEFPGGKLKNGENKIQALIREIKEECGLEIKVEQEIGSIKHIYSHFSIAMTLFQCKMINGQNVQANQPFKWIKPHQIKVLPFPKANHKLFEILNKQGWHV